MNAVGLGGRSPVHILQREKREVLRDLAVTGPGRGPCAAETGVSVDSKPNIRTTLCNAYLDCSINPHLLLQPSVVRKLGNPGF